MPDLSQPGQPITMPMPPVVQQALSGELDRLDGLSKRLDIVITTPPADGSVAATEMTDKMRTYAYDLAATALAAAVDHLRTWRILLRVGVMPTYAHMSLIRTAHESAFFAYWLLEPGLDAPTRRARGIAAQADDYAERRKLEDSVGLKTPPPPNGKLAKDRLKDLMTAAARLGLTKSNKNGDPVLKTVVRGTVELFDLYVPAPLPMKGQWLYRLYSGYAHAKQWALTQGAEPMAPYDSSGRTRTYTGSGPLDSVFDPLVRECS